MTDFTKGYKRFYHCSDCVVYSGHWGYFGTSAK